MSRARGPEGKIQDAVIKYARSKGLLCKKNEVGRYFVSSGWPDWNIYGVLKGLHPGVVFMEFKRPGGKLTPLQESVRKQLADLGFRYYIVDDKDLGKDALDEEFDL